MQQCLLNPFTIGADVIIGLTQMKTSRIQSHTLNLMLGLLLPKHKDTKIFEIHLKPFNVGTQWVAFAEYSQMSTHVPGFSGFFNHFVLAKLATSSIRVRKYSKKYCGFYEVKLYLQVFLKHDQI